MDQDVLYDGNSEALNLSGRQNCRKCGVRGVFYGK